MIITTQMLLDNLADYAAPMNRVSRMVKSGEITPIIRGLYETDKHTSPHLLAGSIYGPSYISFDFALAIHDLIPEAVRAVTCATFEKHKTKRYNTPFGAFIYRDVPSAAFPFGIETRKEGDYFYRIATPEKALCDKLYTLGPVANNSQLEALLFDDLRVDDEALLNLDATFISEISALYASTNVAKLAKYLERRTSR